MLSYSWHWFLIVIGKSASYIPMVDWVAGGEPYASPLGHSSVPGHTVGGMDDPLV